MADELSSLFGVKETRNAASAFVQGKTFLKMLHQHLEGADPTSARATGRVDGPGARTLSLNVPCAAYLNAKLRRHLTPKVEAPGELVQEWLPRESAAGSRRARQGPSTHELVVDLAAQLPAVTALRVEPIAQAPGQEGGTVCNLLVFPGLLSLEAESCAESALVGLPALRPQLQRLSLSRVSLASLRSVLAAGSAPDDPVEPWPQLATVHVSHAGLRRIDSSAAAMSAVRKLELAHNNIPAIENLAACTALEYLDVGFNRVSSLRGAHRSLGRVRSLVLRQNRLTSLAGVEALQTLQRLDVSHNLLAANEEVARLSRLPQLDTVFVVGNPIAFTDNYRVQVLSVFDDPTLLVLDGKPALRAELEALREQRYRRIEPPPDDDHLAAAADSDGLRESIYSLSVDGGAGGPASPLTLVSTPQRGGRKRPAAGGRRRRRRRVRTALVADMPLHAYARRTRSAAELRSPEELVAAVDARRMELRARSGRSHSDVDDIEADALDADEPPQAPQEPQDDDDEQLIDDRESDEDDDEPPATPPHESDDEQLIDDDEEDEDDLRKTLTRMDSRAAEAAQATGDESQWADEEAQWREESRQRQSRRTAVADKLAAFQRKVEALQRQEEGDWGAGAADAAAVSPLSKHLQNRGARSPPTTRMTMPDFGSPPMADDPKPAAQPADADTDMHSCEFVVRHPGETASRIIIIEGQRLTELAPASAETEREINLDALVSVRSAPDADGGRVVHIVVRSERDQPLTAEHVFIVDRDTADELVPVLQAGLARRHSRGRCTFQCVGCFAIFTRRLRRPPQTRRYSIISDDEDGEEDGEADAEGGADEDDEDDPEVCLPEDLACPVCGNKTLRFRAKEAERQDDDDTREDAGEPEAKVDGSDDELLDGQEDDDDDDDDPWATVDDRESFAVRRKHMQKLKQQKSKKHDDDDDQLIEEDDEEEDDDVSGALDASLISDYYRQPAVGSKPTGRVAKAREESLVSKMAGALKRRGSDTPAPPAAAAAGAGAQAEPELPRLADRVASAQAGGVLTETNMNLSVEDNLERYFRDVVFSGVLPSSSQYACTERVVHVFRHDLRVFGDRASAGDDDLRAAIVVTDTSLYVALGDARAATFGDLPDFPVLRKHALVSLESIVIGFSWQRLRLGFQGCDSYVVLTRNRQRTSTLIQQLCAQLEQGGAHVDISNEDHLFLEDVQAVLPQEDADSRIRLYLMLFQRFKRQPGVLHARSLVLTGSHVYLLDEDYASQWAPSEPPLRLLRKARVADVSKVRTDETPDHFTLIIKADSLLSRASKWRLVAPSGAKDELVEELGKL